MNKPWKPLTALRVGDTFTMPGQFVKHSWYRRLVMWWNFEAPELQPYVVVSKCESYMEYAPFVAFDDAEELTLA